MSGIALPDRDRGELPRSPGFVTPCRDDIRQPGLLQFLLQQRRAHDRAVARLLFRRTLRGTAENDRVVAMINRLDVEHRFAAYVGAVVAGPLSERTFRQ